MTAGILAGPKVFRKCGDRNYRSAEVGKVPSSDTPMKQARVHRNLRRIFCRQF
jgi:hypothetical protein